MDALALFACALYRFDPVNKTHAVQWAFAGGGLLQALLWVIASRRWVSLWAVAAGLGLGALLALKAHASPVALAGIGAGVFLSVAYSDITLPRMRESLLLVMNLVWLYVAYLAQRRGAMPRYILLASGIPTLWTLAVSFLPFRLNAAARVLTYVWFLAMTAGVLWFCVPGQVLRVLLWKPGQVELSAGEALLQGMSFSVLSVYAVNLFLLVPIPGKHQSFENRMQQWRELVWVMAGKHDDDQLDLGWAACILLGIGGFLALNAAKPLLDPYTAVSVVVIAPSLLSLGVRILRPEAGPTAPSSPDGD